MKMEKYMTMKVNEINPSLLIVFNINQKSTDIGSGAGDSQCIAVYSVCKELLLHTNLIASSCLSECLENGTSSSSNRPTKAQGIYI